MTISRSSPRIDLIGLGTGRVPAESILDHILERSERPIELGAAALRQTPLLEHRLRNLQHRASLYKRDTGIDGLYIGFPFLVIRPQGSNIKPRIAPVLLWPIKLAAAVGQRGLATLAFDHEREEVRLNPAVEGFLGPDKIGKWRQQAESVLRATVKTGDVMDAFGVLVKARGRELAALPGSHVEVPPGRGELVCTAVLFHVTFMGQAVVEDLRQLKSVAPSGTALESCLGFQAGHTGLTRVRPGEVKEAERFLTVESDPTQEEAVLRARQPPGLLVEGPPGTGKSQTIVSIIADAIGHRKSLLLVCQKQAALEVVHKRLVAEGLANRIVMVTDAQKDRSSVIQSIREQISDLRKNTGSHELWFSQRTKMAARIEALQREVDEHQIALHQIDKLSSLSYRDIIGELVGLESGDRPPVDVRSLRAVVGCLDLASLSAVEEACAPLGRLWLESEYEDNQLVVLNQFGWDAATIDDFKTDFQRFAEAEKTRDSILRKTVAKFDLDDARTARKWLSEYAAEFKDLDDEVRHNLSRWLDKFHRKAGSQSIAKTAMNTLVELLRQTNTLDRQDHDADLFRIILAMDQVALDDWITIATRAVQPVSFIGRLNGRRYLQRRRLSHLLNHSGDAPTDDRMQKFLRAARLENALRPLRTALVGVAKSLGNESESIEKLSCHGIVDRIEQTMSALAEVSGLVKAIVASPRFDYTKEAATANDADAFVKHIGDFELAIARHEARANSFESLNPLRTWFREDWVSDARKLIASNQSGNASIGAIEAKLHTLVAYQHFRVRAGNLPDAAWSVFRALRTAENGLCDIPTAAIDREIRRIINREARLSWKSRIEQANPALLLERAELENRISSLAKADLKMRRLNQKVLMHGIDISCLGDNKKWEDITRLRGARAIPLREFIDRGSDLGLLELRPVWLMNPDVASRILPLKSAMFDTVVYDEASQIPVEYALPTLYRGRRVIVSGDEKQLPPTSFFSSKIESDEAEMYGGELLDDDATEEAHEAAEETWNGHDIKDCPDLLLLARSTLPGTRLEIHYRSSYRELIEFSNSAFYANKLNIPARHPSGKVLEVKPIEVYRVEGTYEHQTNHDEAAAIVNIVADTWSCSGKRRPSLGVVTFNRKQADLIEEFLEERAEADFGFRAAYIRESSRMVDGEDMGFFVKNVENVQGDERDVIVFSTTFGRNPQGTFRRHFGVLGQKGGERRLNVAVTRARQKVILATSMPIAEVSDMLSSHQPPARPRDFLQGYLQYAQLMSDGKLESARQLLKHMLKDASRIHKERDRWRDSFIEAVAAFIRELGCEPVSADDGTAFGVDCAIEDPRTGLYGIGIECDAPSHAMLASARAREIWRPKVLAQSIPCIHRVSSYAWYHDRRSEQGKLEHAINTALT